MERSYEYEKTDGEILSYLAYEGEKKTRKILDHLRDEFEEFARSTLWDHLEKLLMEQKVKRKLLGKGTKSTWLWSIRKTKVK